MTHSRHRPSNLLSRVGTARIAVVVIVALIGVGAVVTFGSGVGCRSSQPREDEWQRLFAESAGAMPSPVVPGRLPRHTVKPLRHEVKPGETFYSISRHYGVSVDRLVSVNPGVEPQSLVVGQALVLPASISNRSKPSVRGIRSEREPVK